MVSSSSVVFIAWRLFCSCTPALYSSTAGDDSHSGYTTVSNFSVAAISHCLYTSLCTPMTSVNSHIY